MRSVPGLPTIQARNVIKNGKVLYTDPSVSIRIKENNIGKAVVRASLGPHVQISDNVGASLPVPALNDTMTAVHGTVVRTGRIIKPLKPELIPKLKKFVWNWLEKNMKPIEPTQEISFEKWIEGTPYPEKRKQELKNKYDKMVTHSFENVPDRYKVLKCFIKDEHYSEYKAARAINSRTDEFKCLVGPHIQAVSDQLFALDWFIKKIPVKERPKAIMEKLSRPGGLFLNSDYTSFEAHFREQLMDAVEMQLFRYMFQHRPEGVSFVSLLEHVKFLEKNKMYFKTFMMQMLGCRMSGEMDTSTSNGFSNLMFMLFMCEELQIETVGYIEGDDGLFWVSADADFDQFFLDLGLDVKLLRLNAVNEASFCGMIFDPDELINVTDVLETITSFGWTTSQYAKSNDATKRMLLRSKALSMAYEYHACPILWALAKRVCDVTRSVDIRRYINKDRSMGQYVREQLLEAVANFDRHKLNDQPGPKTRLLVERLYGIPIDHQVQIEQYLLEFDPFQPIKCELLFHYLPNLWKTHFNEYTLPISRNFNFVNIEINRPHIVDVTFKGLLTKDSIVI